VSTFTATLIAEVTASADHPDRELTEDEKIHLAGEDK
jgi:hypothetical protein